MKMDIVVKLTPENKAEAIDFAKIYARVQEHFEDLKTEGGLPPDASVRFLLKTRKFE